MMFYVYHYTFFAFPFSLLNRALVSAISPESRLHPYDGPSGSGSRLSCASHFQGMC